MEKFLVGGQSQRILQVLQVLQVLQILSEAADSSGGTAGTSSDLQTESQTPGSTSSAALGRRQRFQGVAGNEPSRLEHAEVRERERMEAPLWLLVEPPPTEKQWLEVVVGGSTVCNHWRAKIKNYCVEM